MLILNPLSWKFYKVQLLRLENIKKDTNNATVVSVLIIQMKEYDKLDSLTLQNTK